MALKHYSPLMYMSLGNDVIKASKMVTPEEIFGLGKVIIKHNLEENVCVAIAHRHFDLDDNEVMYEIAESGKRIAEPRRFEELQDAQPCLLTCDINGKWYPVGYGSPAT
uniref:Uncharacterized protein n=1 Tax=Panagrolaimus davidi TaxID=227884 RepID=A0A914PDZ9_9BILA